MTAHWWKWISTPSFISEEKRRARDALHQVCARKQDTAWEWEKHRGRSNKKKYVKIWKNSLVLTGDLQLVVGIWDPDSNTGETMPCKSKVAVLQPSKSARSVRIPACIRFAKHRNLVTINRGEQKAVCADSVPFITAGNKPHQNRSHNKIFPPSEGCSAL